MSEDRVYVNYRNGQWNQINHKTDTFKNTARHISNVVSDGFTSVFQVIPKQTVAISKFKFMFDEQTQDNIIDNDTIGRIVFAQQAVMKQLVKVDTPGAYNVYVMTHPQAVTPDGSIEEIYTIFPNVTVDVPFLVEKFIGAMKVFLDKTGLLNRIDIPPVNEVDDIVTTENFSTGLWPLPGSYIYGKLLTISHVFEEIPVDQVENGNVVGMRPEVYFSNFTIPDNLDYEIASSYYFTDLTGQALERKKRTQKEKTRDFTVKMIEERQRETIRTPVQLATIFVDMLAPERYADEANRNKIGQVIYNLSKGQEQGLELWLSSINYKLAALNDRLPSIEDLAAANNATVEQITVHRNTTAGPHPTLKMNPDDLAETSRLIREAAEDIWNYFQFTETTIGTLKYWAKEDNPANYTSFIEKDVMTLAWKCLNKTAGHTDIAKLCLAKYSDQICCANIKDNLWFGYWLHRWHELDKAHHLRIKISEELPLIFDKIVAECQHEYSIAATDDAKAKWSSLMDSAVKLVGKLKDVNYKNNIVTECCELFYDPNFLNKLDENRMLVGCPNGVIELETSSFRAGKPEDFITLTTGAKYNDNYNWDHPKIKQVLYYLSTVYTDPKLNLYVKKAFGSILEGGNMNKDFYNMVGEGDNSKSMVAKLLKFAFGRYISKIPVAMIMGRRGNADGATPHTADKKGVRALFVEEPPRGDSNVSVVKEMTGGDDILSRALFKMPIIFSPQWKVFVFTNHILEAPAEEKAYWNRQKVVEHDSTYSSNAPVSVDEQFARRIFPKDTRFDQKLKDMSEPFLWCCVKWHRLFQEEGLLPPERVVRATEAAKLRNDAYLQYIRSRLESGDQTQTMSVVNMYADFTGWFKGIFPGKAVPRRDYFEDEMSKVNHLGNRPVGEHWIGVKFKEHTVPLNHMIGAGVPINGVAG